MSNSHRFALLDGIRGIAAVFVLTRHTASFWDLSFHRSYLAVDLFFLLSGFVIAHAYGTQLDQKQLKPLDFIVLRLIRLYPVFLLSLLICLVWFAAQRWVFAVPVSAPEQLGAAALLTALMLPPGLLLGGALFPINSPYWSLFFELVMNFIYGYTKHLLREKHHWLVVGASFLVLTAVAIRHGSLDIGYGHGIQSNVGGFARASFGIFLGALLQSRFESMRAIARRVPPALAVVLIVLVLISPSAGTFDASIDLACVGLIFPVCVASAATWTEGRLQRLWLFLGSASYPIYVLHVPTGQLLSLALGGLERNWAPISGILLVIVLLQVSALIERRLDVPLRRCLNQRFRHWRVAHCQPMKG